VFDEYERRFALARAEKKPFSPWKKEDREAILSQVKSMLGYREELLPDIGEMEEVSRASYGSYDAIQYRYRTWEKFYGASTLYMPHTHEKVPLVFVCCGHGSKGRRSEGYMAMGHRLASLGMAALVMDNIGQGDRNFRSAEFKAPDHWFALAPFYCGLTLQGLIVMETVALIRYMAKDPRFDAERLGACGNSGGGTLTLFLAALAPELAVLSSSGYPAEISYVLQKERRHCACNLLLGSAFQAEMWEIYSLFAPKPLLLSSGKLDNLLPQDLFLRNCRKVQNSYVQMDAKERFSYKLTDTRHPWAIEDVNLISGFLSRTLLGREAEDAEELFAVADPELYAVQMPEDMLSTAELAESLTGKKMPKGTELKDIFPPVFKGERLDPDSIERDVGRGDVMRVFAQYECALLKEKE
ncbi:MAG: acetylxylan esterase, partial [Clostridia bacterium]|nr:acetylxylan esterase [Clostridia bacterium]